MKGTEFLRKIHALARNRGISVRLVAWRGKGSHVMLHLGDRMTVFCNAKDEIKTGTLHAMCKQLGIKKEDL